MKIALITRRFPPWIGGAEKVLSYLATALAAEGAEVTVLTARAGESPAVEATPGGPTIVRLATSRARFVGTWLYMRNLRRWLESHEIDVAYVSMLKHDAYVAVGVGERRGFPVILRPEGAGATGDLAWQAWGRFGRRIGRRCRRADAVVSIAPAIRAELLAAGYDPDRIVDLPNGVPIPADPWHPRTGWHDRPRAAFVGRLAPEKGLDVLLDAWPLVVAEHPKAILTLIGDGPERPRLADRVAALGLGDSVAMPGPSPDPTAALRASDMFVLPSREEGMSIALLEAMALGIPAVATAIPGNLGLVTDRLHARLAPPDDPPALARAVLDQWADLGRAASLADSARRRAVAHFSIAAVARRHLELFEHRISYKLSSRRG
ncbi:MAG TPA: glycosyltransferase family 4 protein [Isosphaeraceae bacterium]|nr:glycosyltransferase family 4 protein [Isosphaeraceae bacterium]